MFLFLSGVAKFFLDPEHQVFFCSLLLVQRARQRKSQAWSRAGQASLAWILILISPLGTLGLRQLERTYPIPEPARLKGKTALILSGNTVLYDTRSGQMDWGADVARVQEPLRLFRLGLFARLVVTGGPVAGAPRRGFLSEAASIAKWWEEMGVPKDAITVEETARNTRENFEHVRPLFRPGEEIVVFTSAYHLPRSMAVARKVLASPVIPYPVDFKANEFSLCSWDNVINARRLVFELVGLAAYRVAGFSS